jgi:hypothetical protein
MRMRGAHATSSKSWALQDLHPTGAWPTFKQASYQRSENVTELRDGKLLFSGAVHVFRLRGHPLADVAYTWTEDDRIVTVLREERGTASPAVAIRTSVARRLPDA